MKNIILLPKVLFGREISSEEVFEKLQQDFLDFVEKRLNEKNMSKSQLAMKLGVSRSAMSKMLSKNNNLTLRKIAEIATALQIDLQFKFDQQFFQNQAKYLFNFQENIEDKELE